MRLSTSRALREVGWSVVIVGVLTSGLTAWILIPSIGSTLSSNLTTYANGVGTYISVEGSGGVIPQSTIRNISAIPGVQEVYPFVVNGTYFVVHNFNTTLGTGQWHVIPLASFGVSSVLVGGPGGFPPALLTLSSGKAPGNEPVFRLRTLLGGFTTSPNRCPTRSRPRGGNRVRGLRQCQHSRFAL